MIQQYAQLIDKMSKGDASAVLLYQCDVCCGRISLEEAVMIDLQVNINKVSDLLDRMLRVVTTLEGTHGQGRISSCSTDRG